MNGQISRGVILATGEGFLHFVTPQLVNGHCGWRPHGFAPSSATKDLDNMKRDMGAALPHFCFTVPMASGWPGPLASRGAAVTTLNVSA
jgi:hypothetical protein